MLRLNPFTSIQNFQTICPLNTSQIIILTFNLFLFIFILHLLTIFIKEMCYSTQTDSTQYDTSPTCLLCIDAQIYIAGSNGKHGYIPEHCNFPLFHFITVFTQQNKSAYFFQEETRFYKSCPEFLVITANNNNNNNTEFSNVFSFQYLDQNI